MTTSSKTNKQKKEIGEKKDHVKYGYIQREVKMVLTPDGYPEMIPIGDLVRTATRCNCNIGKDHEENYIK